MTAQANVLDALANLLASHLQTNKAAGGTPTAITAHGPGGVASVFGLSPDIISAMPMPGTLEAELPHLVSNEEQETFGILTGQTAGTGSEWDAECDDCVAAGSLKLCTQILPFGAFCTDSAVLNVTDVGRVLNRGEFVDQRIVNNPLSELVNVDGAGFDPAAALRDEKAKLMTEMFVEHYRRNAPVAITGTPVNNSATGGYKEFYGLQSLVNTGYRDARTGVACKAADSMLYNFNAGLTGNEAALVTRIVNTYRALKYLAYQTRMRGVEWALVGRYEFFSELVNIWACAYYTTNCIVADTTTGSVNVDGVAVRTMRDQMYAGRYLMIEGERVPFIIDDTLPETIATAGAFRSDLYFVPLRAAGVGPLTYFQYRDMRVAARFDAEFAGTFFTPVSNGMHLLIRKAPTNTCIQYQVKTFKRLIIRAPFLAARIQNITVTPQIHSRGWDPDDTYYFVNGGATTRSTPYFYPPN